jgi:hypothetical protein
MRDYGGLATFLGVSAPGGRSGINAFVEAVFAALRMHLDS